MKRNITLISIPLFLMLSLPVVASDTHDHGAKKTAAPAGAAAMAEAEVRKVDKDAGKVTLKHGEIKNLDMPPMTMVFRVKDAALLDKLSAGDKIKFEAEKINGAYTVTRVEKAGK